MRAVRSSLLLTSRVSAHSTTSQLEASRAHGLKAQLAAGNDEDEEDEEDEEDVAAMAAASAAVWWGHRAFRCRSSASNARMPDIVPPAPPDETLPPSLAPPPICQCPTDRPWPAAIGGAGTAVDDEDEDEDEEAEPAALAEPEEPLACLLSAAARLVPVNDGGTPSQRRLRQHARQSNAPGRSSASPVATAAATAATPRARSGDPVRELLALLSALLSAL